jgi:tetratricopeptide (TPR) repeat protein
MPLWLTRARLLTALAVTAIAAGAACWLLVGPPWAALGAVGGPAVVVVALVWAVGTTHAHPAELLRDHEPYRALTQLQPVLESLRYTSRRWPGVTSSADVLAHHLLIQAESLLALGRLAEAPGPAAEAVSIFRTLADRKPHRFTAALSRGLDRQARVLAAAGREADAVEVAREAARLYRNLDAAAPGKHLPALAGSLTDQAQWLSDMRQDDEARQAVDEAVTICQDRLPRADQPSCAAQALLLQGRLRVGQARHREAAAPLARGWQLAASREQTDLLAPAAASLRAAYQADEAAVRSAWRIETGGDPPQWLTGFPQPPS